MDSSSADAAVAAASSSPAAPAAAATSPAPLPFDWYSDPLFYDIIFEEDTVFECNMLRAIAKQFAPAGSPLKQIVLATSEQEEKQGTSKSSSQSAAVPSAPASSGVIRVLEPACGSARLMLAMIEAGRRLDPSGVRWATVGFDLSRGAIDFARQRWNEAQEAAQMQQQLKSLQLSSDPSAAAAPSLSIAAVDPPPFTVFEADMSNFSAALAQHAPWAGASAAPSSSSAAAALTPAPASGFDVAHCLVSSIKHLLDPAEVQRHFEQVADSLATDGIYIVALHIHTLEGRSHFDRRVNYAAATANASAAAASASSAAAPFPAAASAASSSAAVPSPAAAAVSDDEVDDEHTGEYSRGSTKFTAELITYAPDAATMTEKMIARVSKKDDAEAAVATDTADFAASASPSSPPLQTDMSLRVYTLSSLHSLLCGLSRFFHLVGCYNYSDIYDSEWSAEERCQLTWPFPLPSEEQIKNTSGTGAATSAAAASAVPSLLLPAPRNWNRVYRVPRAVRAQWEDVEAIVIVLRKASSEEAQQQRWHRECTIHRARLARILDREAAETAKSSTSQGSSPAPSVTSADED